jgi:hypothetical protein
MMAKTAQLEEFDEALYAHSRSPARRVQHLRCWRAARGFVCNARGHDPTCASCCTALSCCDSGMQLRPPEPAHQHVACTLHAVLSLVSTGTGTPCTSGGSTHVCADTTSSHGMGERAMCKMQHAAQTHNIRNTTCLTLMRADTMCRATAQTSISSRRRSSRSLATTLASGWYAPPAARAPCVGGPWGTHVRHDCPVSSL